MKIRDTIAARLQAALDERGWSNRQLHRTSGVSASQIGDILLKRKSPTVDVLARIAAALRIPVWWLVAPEEVENLLADFARCDQSGRAVVLAVASAQASQAEKP